MKKPQSLVSDGAPTYRLSGGKTSAGWGEPASHDQELRLQKSQFITDALGINRTNQFFCLAATSRNLSRQGRSIGVGVHHRSLLVLSRNQCRGRSSSSNLDVQSSRVFGRFKDVGSANFFGGQSTCRTSFLNGQVGCGNSSQQVASLFTSIHRTSISISGSIPAIVSVVIAIGESNNCGGSSYHFRHINLSKLSKVTAPHHALVNG